MSNKDTSDLIFHINKILIDNSTLSIKSLTDNSFNQINNFKWKNDYERQFFVANLAQTFKANNNYTVSMKFTGYLASDNAGFYRSSYLDADKNKIWLLASQMQPTDARKAFPCFDEPGMKATYKISVEHRSDYNAISNMPVEKITHL
jgi:aminopeptidase N